MQKIQKKTRKLHRTYHYFAKFVVRGAKGLCAFFKGGCGEFKVLGDFPLGGGSRVHFGRLLYSLVGRFIRELRQKFANA